MSNLAVSINRVGKAYRINRQQDRPTTLGEALGNLFSGRLSGSSGEQFWALRDMTLEVQRSEVLGIIGGNGAGKTTLLKILSRITEPTTGQIDLYGRVGSLLEVGTGFHPELTGRENIYLNGSILGMSRQEIDSRFDSIVDFAETERFLDTPVKRYSSGMYVRLAFAVAAHLDPEILIVDEVLAVGDLQFQQKSMSRLETAASREGKTILFVSHNMAAVAKLCHRVVLLEEGRLRSIGPPSTVLPEYIHGIETEKHAVAELAARELPEMLEKLVVKTFNSRGLIAGQLALGEPWSIRFEFELRKTVQHCIAAIGLQTLESVPIITFWSQQADLGPGVYAVDFQCEVTLSAGPVSIVAGLTSFERVIFYREGITQVSISELASDTQPHRASGAGLLTSFVRPEICKIGSDAD
jgi:lipopolysaccharide transport system ATP-binding protein